MYLLFKLALKMYACLLSCFSCDQLFETPWTIAHQGPQFPLSIGLSQQEWEWVAMRSSRGSSWLREWTCIFYISYIAGGFFIIEPLGICIIWKMAIYCLLYSHNLEFSYTCLYPCLICIPLISLLSISSSYLLLLPLYYYLLCLLFAFVWYILIHPFIKQISIGSLICSTLVIAVNKTDINPCIDRNCSTARLWQDC